MFIRSVSVGNSCIFASCKIRSARCDCFTYRPNEQLCRRSKSCSSKSMLARFRIDSGAVDLFSRTHSAHQQLRLFAIDESHCVSSWGHDFRPKFRQLAFLKIAHPHVPCIALTATATETVVNDVMSQLRLAAPRCFRLRFFRPRREQRANFSAAVCTPRHFQF